MLYNAAKPVEKGLLKSPLHVQFVLGVSNALPARSGVFDYLRTELAVVASGTTWVAAGTGRFPVGGEPAVPRAVSPETVLLTGRALQSHNDHYPSAGAVYATRLF